MELGYCITISRFSTQVRAFINLKSVSFKKFTDFYNSLNVFKKGDTQIRTGG